jgi:zinc protease
MLTRFLGLTLVPLLLLAPPAQAANPVQQVESPMGIDIWLMQSEAVPVISVEFAFRGGTATDPEGLEGRANLAMDLLTEGAGDLDSAAFQEALQRDGIQLSFDAGTDAVFGSLKTTTETADTAFDLLRLALGEPRFDQEAIGRVKGRIEASIRRNTGDPDWLARRAFYDTLWGDHPYGRPSRGTMESLDRLAEADLRDFVSARLTRDQLVVAMVGDVDAATAGRLVDGAFAALPAEGVSYTPPPAEIMAEPGLSLITRDGVQSTLILGQDWVMPTDPEWETALVLNHILGGGSFSSRLVQEVREDRGLTYGISSFPISFDAGSLIMVRSALSNANVAEALGVIRDVWTDLATEGPSAAEVDDAKAFLTGAWPLRFSSTDRTASVLLSLRLDGRPPSDLEARNERVAAVTVEQVRALAARLLDPDELISVVVGTGEGLAPDRTRPAQDLVDRELAGS